jgi:uncharacterized protein (UPF0332 family)
MTVQEQVTFLTKEYTESIRYMDNAEAVLEKAKKDGKHYKDKKYVRMACATAYNGVLLALDAWFVLKGIPSPSKKQRKSIEYYYENLAKIDKKLLTSLHAAYNVLHLDGYYDGITNVKTIASGFEEAYDIIEKIKPTAE